tara:strand:+ start:245 stop:439 length:195 start_codon:yes stop_codon:yes gene_type:complete
MSTAKRIVLSYATRKLLNISVADSSLSHIQNKAATTKSYTQWKPVNHHKIDKANTNQSVKNINH